MATMKIRLTYIDSVKPDLTSGGSGAILVGCDMDMRGLEDTISQICEQMGDDAFMEYVKNMMNE